MAGRERDYLSGMQGLQGPPDAFRVFPTSHPTEPSTLRGQVLQALNREVLNLRKAEDWSDFKYRCGLIRGLEIANDICNDIEKER